MSSNGRLSIQDVRVFQGADCGSDHSLLGRELCIKIKKITKKSPAKPFDIRKLKDDSIAQSFRIELSNRFQTLQDSEKLESKWVNFKIAVTKAAETVISFRRGSQREMWISATWDLIDQRKNIKLQKDHAKTLTTSRTLDENYRATKKAVKGSCKIDKKNWLESKYQEAEQAAPRNESRTLFRIVRNLTFTDTSRSIPIKSKTGKVISSEEEQNQR